MPRPSPGWRGHLQTLLEGIVANPAQRLSDLPLLTAAERQHLLVTWNTTQTTIPRLVTFPALFEAQVAADARGRGGGL